MKIKMSIIISLVIFAAAFYFNVASSYAFDLYVPDSGYYIYGSVLMSPTNEWGLAVKEGYTIYPYYIDSNYNKYAILVNTSTWSIVESYLSDTTYSYNTYGYTFHNDNGTIYKYKFGQILGNYSSNDNLTFGTALNTYPDYNSAYQAYLNHEGQSSYDSSIGIGLEAWTVLDFDANFLSNSILNCGCFFRSNDSDHVDIFISGAKKTDTITVSGSYGSHWFSMTDYADPGDTVTICFTPYDSIGNWGNTLVISQPIYTSIVQDLYQFFTGYTKKVTNDLDIIGISDPTVVTVEPKPTTVPPPITNPIKSSPLYVPVFQGGNGDDVINNYLVNNYTVYNDYSTVNNIINITTNIKIDYTNPGIDDIEIDIKGYSDLWVNFLNLFDSFFPFFGGVGSLAVKLFIAVFGVIVAYVPLKILVNFIRR